MRDFLIPIKKSFLYFCSAIFCMACGGEASESLAPWPDSNWTPSKKEYGMVVEKRIPVTMDDGATLYVDVGYPADPNTGERADGEFPVLLTQNPYMVPGTNSSAISPTKYFVSRGYIYAVAQIRGTGRTTGPGGEPVVFDMFNERMAQDGVELVRWAAEELDQSNGDIGLDGCSFLGITQLFTAAAIGPNSPIKAILPTCAGTGYELYFPGGIMGGTLPLSGLRPANLMMGMSNFSVNADHQSALTKKYEQGEREAYNDEYWQTRDTINTGEKIVANGIPVLLYTGWQAAEMGDTYSLFTVMQNAYAGRDVHLGMSPDQQGTGRYQMIMGPWGHGMGIEDRIKLQWFDHWVKGQDTGLDEINTPAHLWELESERWVHAERIPLTDRYTTLYSNANGSLSTEKPEQATQPLQWVQPDQPQGKLIYTSAPAQRTWSIAGPISVSIWASSSNTNMALIASLYDVAPDGTRKEISHGSLIGSLRENDPSKTWLDSDGKLILPSHPYFTDDYLVPGKIERLDIRILPTMWSLAEGHSLQLEITSQTEKKRCQILNVFGPPMPCQPSEPQADSLKDGEYSVFSGGETPTLVNLPLR